jgi:hypothetical protein
MLYALPGINTFHNRIPAFCMGHAVLDPMLRDVLEFLIEKIQEINSSPTTDSRFK